MEQIKVTTIYDIIPDENLKLLCKAGLHAWMYLNDPFSERRFCKNCGLEQEKHWVNKEAK